MARTADGAGRLREPMDVMAHTRTGRRHLARARRVRLAREPAAAALARREVRAAIGDWGVEVDADVAVLLASDLVTNAIIRGEGAMITLAVRCAAGRLRVDVYDTWRALPVVLETGASSASGPGLALVATLSDEWGTFRTPAGMAVYFALGCEPGRAEREEHTEHEEEEESLPAAKAAHARRGSHVGAAGRDAPRQPAAPTARVNVTDENVTDE